MLVLILFFFLLVLSAGLGFLTVSVLLFFSLSRVWYLFFAFLPTVVGSGSCLGHFAKKEPNSRSMPLFFQGRILRSRFLLVRNVAKKT